MAKLIFINYIPLVDGRTMDNEPFLYKKNNILLVVMILVYGSFRVWTYSQLLNVKK